MEVFINRQTIGLLHFLPIPTSELDSLSSEFPDFWFAFARRPQSRRRSLRTHLIIFIRFILLFLFASSLNNDI